jgi:type VI secretion system secreted protein Hcp
MAFDAFLKMTTIPGESTDDKHKDWIEILSYNQGVSQPRVGTGSSSGAQSAQRADFGDFSFVHHLDKASPKLFLACATGEHISEATLQLHRATGDKQKYMEYKMTDVIVTSVRPAGASQGGDTLPLEEFSLNYSKIEWTYTSTDNKTGKPMGDVKTHWDRSINKGG